MEGNFAAPLKLQPFPNIHSKLDLLFPSHISPSSPCLLQQVQWEPGEVLQVILNSPPWWSFYGQLSGMGLNINGIQWKLFLGSKKDPCSQAGVLPGLEELLSCRQLLPCHCLSLLSIRNSSRAAAEQPGRLP